MIHDTTIKPVRVVRAGFESAYGTDVSLRTGTEVPNTVAIEFSKTLQSGEIRDYPNAIVDVDELRRHLDALYPPKGKVIPIRPSLERAKRDLFDAALIPDDDTIHEGEEFILRDEKGEVCFGTAFVDFVYTNGGCEWRLLEPRPTPEATDEELAVDELFDDLVDLDLEEPHGKLARQLVEAGWRKVA